MYKFFIVILFLVTACASDYVKSPEILLYKCEKNILKIKQYPDISKIIVEYKNIKRAMTRTQNRSGIYYESVKDPEYWVWFQASQVSGNLEKVGYFNCFEKKV